jgi:hypothetical protein
MLTVESQSALTAITMVKISARHGLRDVPIRHWSQSATAGAEHLFATVGTADAAMLMETD